MSLNPIAYIRAISSLRLRILSWCLRCSGGALLVVSVAIPFGERWQQATKIATATGAALMIGTARASSHGARRQAEFEQALHQQSLANFIQALKPPKEMEAGELDPGEPVKIFDWNRFSRESHKFPHILILAPTGEGKTTIAEWLLSLLPGKAKVVTTKRKSRQWRGLEVVGTPRNFGAIQAELRLLVRIMTLRVERLDELEASEQLNIAIDEVPAIAANCDGAVDDILSLIREARESLMRLIVLSQGKGVRTLGIEGQSDLLDCLCMVRLGKFALKHCEQLVRQKELPQRALDWLQHQSRPAMVDDEPCAVPDLSGWVPPGSAPGSTGTWNPLEPDEGSTLEPSSNQDGTQLEPDKTDPLEPLSEETVLRVLALHQEGKTQSEILSEVWGVSKGGSKRFLVARDLYKSITDN